MSLTPPPVREVDFLAVDTINEEDIKGRFTCFLQALHSYLNQLACLRDIQKTRRRWRPRTLEIDAFGNFATKPEEWYTYYHGGRNEAHFDIGLHPQYFRFGLRFEFSHKKGGDPNVVQLAYTCFTNVIKASAAQFTCFVNDNHLEIEWVDNKGGSHQFVPTANVMTWLLNLPTEPSWIFIGKLLRRGQDTASLENPDLLGDVMRTVLCGFRPIWEKTQLAAYAAR